MVIYLSLYLKPLPQPLPNNVKSVASPATNLHPIFPSFGSRKLAMFFIRAIPLCYEVWRYRSFILATGYPSKSAKKSECPSLSASLLVPGSRPKGPMVVKIRKFQYSCWRLIVLVSRDKTLVSKLKMSYWYLL